MKDSVTLKDMSAQILELRQVTHAMKEYTESIMREVKPENFESIIIREEEILRAAKVNRFEKEYLIDFTLATQKNLKLTAANLFAAFERSTTLEDFVQNAGLPQYYYDYVTNEPEAQKEYLQLKRTYSDD